MKKLIIILAVLCAAAVAQARPLGNQPEVSRIIVDRYYPPTPPPRIHSWPMLIAYLRWLAR